MTALISMAGVFSLKALRASGATQPYDSQFITGPKGLGLEFSSQRPYARLVRVSHAAVSLPLAAGAYVAMASATGAASPPNASGTAAPDAGAVEPDCSSGGGGGGGGGGGDVIRFIAQGVFRAGAALTLAKRAATIPAGYIVRPSTD